MQSAVIKAAVAHNFGFPYSRVSTVGKFIPAVRGFTVIQRKNILGNIGFIAARR